MRLNAPVSNLPFIGPVYVKRLKKLEIVTVKDLLHHVPYKYLDFRKTSSIKDLRPGEVVTVQGEIVSITNQYTRSRKKIQIATIADSSDQIEVVWFNQPFLLRTLRKGAHYNFSGKVDWFGRKKALISPDYEKPGQSIHTKRLVPVYHETAGLSSKWLRSRINQALKVAEPALEFLPKKTLADFQLIGVNEAIRLVHYPQTMTQANSARRRLAFNELFFLQFKNLYRKLERRKSKSSFNLSTKKAEVEKFITSLPFSLTESQDRSIKEILTDLGKDFPMNRLLEGDVGSGKTVVAATACLVSFLNGYQSVIMAPTQILARQHFETLQETFSSYKIRIHLITSRGQEGDAGNSDIVVGTHALIHKSVNFDQVALAVIDEQHRFGVEQRAHLTRKSSRGVLSPHTLTMTATPIPRTIVLTLYGDLSLSTLNELPGGRKKITTWIVPPAKRQSAHAWVEEQITKSGVQAFFVCPLVD
ncbi:MAG: ATP-dependent DNA helicase RecG, partial [Nitrospinota bacterium]